ncbi:MAG: homoaconitate hydratase, partial [Candidatus Methanomethylophilaceae archaeon]|nr:homoaconitate hydratase [Candidatus Methanomethylophilaceae archaeon]
PFSTFERVKILKQVTEMDIEIQSRNDFGLATANSLAGIKAGATFVGASLLGIGSRAGNAPLEEVALISEEKLKMSTGINLTALKSAAVALSRASGRKIWESKPVLGSGCFAQEAGLSADGSSSAIEILEPYNPAVVGGEREVVLGKHCSVESVIYLLKSLDLGIDPDQAEELTELVRQNASDQHRSLSTDDLYELYQDLMSGTVFRDEEDDEDFDSKRNPVDEE